MDGIKDFLILHHHATNGWTEPFWRERQQMPLPCRAEALRAMMAVAA